MSHRIGARAWRAAALASALAVVFAVLQGLPARAQSAADSKAAGKSAFTLASPDITNGGTIAAAQVFNSFGCTGRNISPALSWSHAPAGTRSFALLVHDPDAPTGSGWWHWVAYNIPATVTSLPAGAGDPARNLMPAGTVQGRTDFGSPGYGGPCPPPGKPHHYYFRLYALKVARLDLPADATPALVGFNVNANSLGKAELLGLYGR
ncbi:MAG TPA: YbhB/YbcL family Raf kinase inhibitor-like protein [Steroidobacteraceae bacterium]|nr:YbhB/YbcL family Raf kinase inhibitor-like protein [Steroidobacteraceae bacterium]